jgi:hypothetical protein
VLSHLIRVTKDKELEKKRQRQKRERKNKRVRLSATILKQGSFFWLQNTEGKPVIGGWLQIHQPQVLPPYFAARKKNPILK